MCGRATLTKSIKEIEDHLQAAFNFPEQAENRLPNFNIAPTHDHPVVTNEDQEHIQLFRWGLIPFWAKDKKIGSRMINARLETILEKPAFRGINKRRCVVPFDGFYEWKRTPDGKIPYRITRKDEAIFTIAGIWETWKSKEGETIHSFTLITRPPNELVAELHDRMPALLLPEQERDWLDMSIPAKEAIKLLEPFPADLMNIYPVSKRVNKVAENDKELILPLNEKE